MSQPDQTASPVLFTGPSFHVSGVQLVPDAGEVSLYFTATRHAFSPNATQVRAVNEVVARVVMSSAGAERVAELLRAYVEALKQPKS
jgi:hypothetical protein